MLMTTPTGLLPELHDLHLRLQELQGQLAKGPRAIAAREKAAADKQQDLEQLKQKLTDLRKSADQKSLQLKTNEAKIQDLQGKLNTASTNKEYDIIRTQIDADKMANSVLEDEILEAYEKVDACQRDIAAANEELKALENAVTKTRQDVDAARAGLEADAAKVETELHEYERQLPATIMEVYRRLVQAHGAGALTEVEGDACGACFSIFSPQERVQLNTGKIVLCRICGRMMYRRIE